MPVDRSSKNRVW